MKDLKINVAAPVKPEVTIQEPEVVVETPKVEPVKAESVKPTSSAKPVEGAFTGRDLVPSDWVIEPTETGIYARNNNTRSVFEGTMQEFNAKLRG